VDNGRWLLLGVVALLLVFALVLTGALTGAQLGYERSVNGVVDRTLTEPQYETLTLRTVKTEYGGWSGATPNVTVTVIRSSNANYSSLPSTLERRIEQRTGTDVRVSVQYTESRSVDVRSTRRGDADRFPHWLVSVDRSRKGVRRDGLPALPRNH
jgi:hypothetical protein